MIDLFKPVVPAARFHPQFVSLRQSPFHATARALISELYNAMGDPNGRFVRDFQSHGFHARLFELSCFAYLQASGLSIDRNYESPDFIVSNGKHDLAVEVTTANPPLSVDPDISLLRMEPLSELEVIERASVAFPGRMIRSLNKKLNHAYHEMPHVAGKPFVLMVAPFFEPGSGCYVDESLLPALYPVEPDFQAAPFFTRPEAASISAVAYCNSFTVSKLWRLSDPAYAAQAFLTDRFGVGYFENNPSLQEFRFRLGHPATPPETWPEGVTLFFNPLATTPLPEDLLPASSIFVCVEDQLFRRVRGFHPLASGQIAQPR